MKIKCAAIKNKNGQIFAGRSHADIFQSQTKGFFHQCVQGFVTSKGKFVDRKVAAKIAFEAGQIPKLKTVLFSEDLTGDWSWKTEGKIK